MSVAGDELLGHGGATDKFTSLENERLQAGIGEVVGCDEAVVAGTDNDCIP